MLLSPTAFQSLNLSDLSACFRDRLCGAMFNGIGGRNVLLQGLQQDGALCINTRVIPGQ